MSDYDNWKTTEPDDALPRPDEPRDGDDGDPAADIVECDLCGHEHHCDGIDVGRNDGMCSRPDQCTNPKWCEDNEACERTKVKP